MNFKEKVIPYILDVLKVLNRKIKNIENNLGDGLTSDSVNTLTNKTISGVDNTITNISYSNLTNTPTIPNNTNYVDLTSTQTNINGSKTFIGPYSTAQISVGSSTQGGRIRFLSGTGGTSQVAFGYMDATTTQSFINASSNLPFIVRNIGGGGVNIESNNAAGDITLSTNTTPVAKLLASKNLLIQNGGTFTDSGEKLQVVGNSKFTGAIETSENLKITKTSGAIILKDTVTNIDQYIRVTNGVLIVSAS